MIDWSIIRSAGPVDIAGNFARGYQLADTIISKIHERNALGYLARNPDDQNALAQLYQANPTMGAHFEERGQKLAETRRRAALAQQYQGDPTGARQAAIGAGDFDLAEQFNKLDETTQKRAADFWEKAGPVAYELKKKTDPAERQALWQQAKPILQSEGIDQAQLDKFDPMNDAQLDAAITTAQKMSEIVGRDKKTWVQQGPNPSFAVDAMGNPVGTQNPGSSQLPTVGDQKSYDAVPPGGHYMDPSGHVRVKGGQSSASSAGEFR
jgi:hypothetical protein